DAYVFPETLDFLHLAGGGVVAFEQVDEEARIEAVHCSSQLPDQLGHPNPVPLAGMLESTFNLADVFRGEMLPPSAREPREGPRLTGHPLHDIAEALPLPLPPLEQLDRKSTRLNSSHVSISYAV